MMGAFARGNIDGEAKAAVGSGVVERGCEELAWSCKRETFRNSGSEETWSNARRGGSEGHETGNQFPFDQKETSLESDRRPLGLFLGQSRPDSRLLPFRRRLLDLHRKPMHPA